MKAYTTEPVLDNCDDGLGCGGEISAVDCRIARRTARERSTVNPDKNLSAHDKGQWGGNEPEESWSVATGTDGVGNIDNHIKAVLGRGARARLGASRRKVL